MWSPQKPRNPLLVFWILLVLVAFPSLASATLITRYFEFSSTSGPLSFGPNVGWFEYDDSVAPVGGGYVKLTGLFSGLSVGFDGFSFDETTANSGWLQFDAAGELLEAHFGNNCFAGGCAIGAGAQEWWVRVGVPGTVNDFAYSGFNGATQFFNTYDNRLIPNRIPEPSAPLLFGAGILVVGRARRRRRAG